MRFRDGVKIFVIVLLALALEPRHSEIRINVVGLSSPAAADEPLPYIEPEARFIGGAELWFEPSTAPVILAEERV
jgi:hypothetical protein